MKLSFIGNPFMAHKREEVVHDHDGGSLELLGLIPGVEFLDPAYVSIWRNGSRLEGPFDEHLTVQASALDQFIVVRSPGLPAATPAIWVFLFNAAVSIAASMVIGALMKPDTRTQDKVDEGPTYGFAGVTSQRHEGRPQQVVYGRIRTGGTLISEVIDNTHNAWGTSTYRAQIAFGEGPIYAIADVPTETPDDEPLEIGSPGNEIPPQIEIEGTPASGLSSVEAWVRLGTLEQTHVPTFNFSEVYAPLGTPLYAPADLAANGATPLIEFPSTALATQTAILDQYGVSTDILDEVDSVRISVRFPSGYFRTSGGSVVGRWWSFYVRYIRLDAGGVPIAAGGEFGDGWVRVVMPRQALASTSPFSIEYHVRLLNPSGYVPAFPGYSMHGVWSAHATGSIISSPTLPAIWDGASKMPDFTFSSWVRLTDVADGSTIRAELLRHGDITVADNLSNGVRFGFSDITYDTAPGFQVTRIVPTLTLFRAGSSPRVVYEGMGEAYHTPSWWAADGVATLHHFAVTYKKDIGDGRSRTRIYADGQMLVESLSTYTADHPSGEDIWIATYAHASIHTCGINLDETWYYAAERTLDDISNEYNNGAGMVGAVSPNSDPHQYQILDPNLLVCGFHFNEGTGAGSTAQDFGDLGNDLVCASGSVSLDGAFIVGRRTSLNSSLRSRYRVEVMRNIPDSTDANSFDDECEIEAVSGVTDARFSYPTTPYLSLTVPAQEQLGTNIPSITTVVSGRILPQWYGGDPTNPTFTYGWSRNPAWVVLDRLTNERYGLGQFFGPQNIDVLSFLEWALYCAEPLYDLRNSYVPGRLLTPSVSGYSSLLYNSNVAGESQFDGRGRISVLVPGSLMLTAGWTVGGYVAFVGEHEEPLFVEWTHTHGEGGGYEIESMSWNGSSWVVWLYYDRLSEGDPWTDGGYLSSEPGFPGTGNYAGTAEGRIPRHFYDAVHDTAESDWETIQQIAAVGRAAVILEGNRVRVRINKPRDPIGVVSVGTIIEGSFEVDYGGPAERENAYTIEFLDEDANWERKPAYAEHSSVQNVGDLDEIRHDSLFIRGITRRAAALRHGHFLLNINQSINRTGKFRASVAAIHYEVGDVLVVQHDVLEWGQGGRCYETESDNTTLTTDREVTLEAATTYYVDVIDKNSGSLSTAEVTTVAGTYDKGKTLTLASPYLAFIPQDGQPYVVYSLEERMLIEVVDIELTRELEVGVQWVEYNEDVYDDVTEDIDALASTCTGGIKDDTGLQEQVEAEQAVARISLGSGGDDEVRLTGGWKLPLGTRRRGARVALWTRLSTAITDGNRWELRVEVPMSDGSATITLPDARTGDIYDIAFQAISPGGQRRAPERSPHRRVYVGSEAFRADPPTSLTATMESGKATYRIVPAANATGCFHEIRRGGWILGQVVAVLPPGRLATEPTGDWASGSANTAGRQVPTLYCRSMTPSGRYSASATELAFDPDPSFGMDIREDGGTLEFFSDQSWEDFGIGWVSGGSLPQATLSRLQVVSTATTPTHVALPSAQYLTFLGAGLVGTYETAHNWAVVVGSTWKPEWFHVEFFVEGYQVHPGEFADNEGKVNAWSALRMTPEGPLDTLPDETVNVTALIEIKSIQEPGGAWSDWQTFVPGDYYGALFYFRVTFTRPDSTYDIVIHRIHQRFRRINRVRWERSPANRALTQEVTS